MLAQAQLNDRVHHAYLFAGPAGIGKRRVAYAWMARLACLAPVAGGDACGECRNCRRILGHAEWYDQNGPWKPPPPEPNAPLTPIHPDVATLVPYGGQIRIEQVREVRRIAQFPPVELPFRFILIDPADALNEAAANALLKTLEEPPSQTRFILLSESPTSLLVTIRSRCQRVDFHRLSENVVEQVVARVMPDVAPEQRARAARIAHGSAALALALVDDPVLQAWMPIARQIAAAANPSLGAVLAIAQQMADLGDAGRAFEFLIRLLRDALLLRVGSPEPVFHQELDTDVRGFAARHSVDGLLHRIRIAEDTRMAVQTYNVPLVLGCERLLLEVIGRDGAEEARPVMSARNVL
jgi:DNA polymerase-3 subunit delta'